MRGLIYLLLIGALIARNSHQQDGSLLNKSLSAEVEHGTRSSGDRDMWSMVAAMKGESNSMSVAEYNRHGDLGITGKHRFHYDWHVDLDANHKYRLDWSVNYPANEVIFGLQVNTSASQFVQGSDIFALGFSSYGQLESSDFCIIWYDLGHRPHLQDAKTDHLGKLRLIGQSQSFCQSLHTDVDHSQKKHYREEIQAEDDDENIDSSIQHKMIELASFKRPLDTCDESSENNYYRIDNGTTHLVWFVIKGPLLAIDDLDLNQLSSVTRHHQLHEDDNSKNPSFEFGLKRVQLVATRPQNLEVKKIHSAKSMAHDIRMDRFEIPGKETTYWCKLLKLPRKFENRKYHITKYEAVIDSGNEHIVHHMELFNCANLTPDQELELTELNERPGSWSGDCSGLDRPTATQPCRKVIMAWAMGAHPLEYPEQVGQAIGGLGYSPYVVLEVHYNNVQLQAGLLDSSGLRFHYSSKLRPYDAGVLEVGLEYTDKNSIPPRMVAPIAGYCHSECTRVAMSQKWDHPRRKQETGGSTGDQHQQHLNKEDGIYIFAGQMHTHLVGVASWTEQVREGKVIGELQRDNHYSPHFQEIRLLPEPVYLAPGDALVHYCLYDTRQRVNITLGGFATSDEMCVTYLHYYPRIDLEVCKSSVDTEALAAYFDHLAADESQPANASGPVSVNYKSIEWSPRRSEELLEFYNKAPLSIQCNKSNGDRHAGYWNGIPPTSTWRPEHLFSERTARPSGHELAAYRGRNASLFLGRHAQCTGQKSDHLRGIGI